jgi:hypothetical protein
VLLVCQLVKQCEDVDVRYMCLRDLAHELNQMRLQQQQQSMQSSSSSPLVPNSTSAAPVVLLMPLDSTSQSRLCKVIRTQLMSTQGEIHEAALRWSDAHRTDTSATERAHTATSHTRDATRTDGR